MSSRGSVSVSSPATANTASSYASAHSKACRKSSARARPMAPSTSVSTARRPGGDIEVPRSSASSSQADGGATGAPGRTAPTTHDRSPATAADPAPADPAPADPAPGATPAAAISAGSRSVSIRTAVGAYEDSTP